jgi:hypothetical protein
VKEKSLTDLAVMKVKISDSAVPGSKIVISGEISHPGNHYRASRVEAFSLESIVSINPAVETSLDYDNTPKTAGFLGGVKSHDIDFTLAPKYEGVEEAYEVSIEELGSSYVSFEATKVTTGRLARGVGKKVNFGYRLAKSAKGKTINLKITVKNGSTVVKVSDFQIKPQ